MTDFYHIMKLFSRQTPVTTEKGPCTDSFEFLVKLHSTVFKCKSTCQKETKDLQ